MRCFGITKKTSRCKNKCNFVFCKTHKLQWWGIVLIFATLGGIFQDIIRPIFSFTFSSIPKDNKEKRVRDNKLFEDTSDFNILILPLTPDKECKIENTNYENMIIGYLKELKEKYSLNLNAKLGPVENCPNSNDEAIRIGDEVNSSLVIWGQYDESCSGPTKVRIRYNLLKNNFSKYAKSTGDTKMVKVNNISDIRDGYLIRNTEDIIYRNIAIQLYRIKKYKESLELLNKISLIDCDIELGILKSLCLERIDQRLRSMEVYKKASACATELILQAKKESRFELAKVRRFIVKREIFFNKIDAYIFYARQHYSYKNPSMKFQIDKMERINHNMKKDFELLKKKFN